jgi:hypothetical protein
MKNSTNQNIYQGKDKCYGTSMFYKTIKIYIVILLLLAAFIPAHIYAQFVQQGNKLAGNGFVSISADGNTAVIGAPGGIFIYTRSGGVWKQQGNKLVGKGAVGKPPSDPTYQGYAVSISADGNTVIEGGQGDNDFEGAAWVFTRTNGVWAQQGNKLVGTGATTFAAQGSSVAISGDGNTAIVGAPDDNNDIGAVWIYTRTKGVWTQQGSKLVGTGARTASGQGHSVSISYNGNTAIVGGPGDGGENKSTGASWVFTRTNGAWAQQGIALIGTGGTPGNIYQGISVSISGDGNTAIVGGWHDNNIRGAAWVFTRTGTTWAQQGSKLVGTGAVDTIAQQGWFVSISYHGDTAIVGGPGDNNGVGAVWVYTRKAGVWAQLGNKLVGTGAVGKSGQGESICISSDGSTAIVGGTGDNNKGAAWVFINGKAPGLEQRNADVETITLTNTADLKLYPNPARDNVAVEFTANGNTKMNINAYDLLGHKLINNETITVQGKNIFNLNTSKLGNGVYILEIENNGSKQYSKFLISR